MSARHHPDPQARLAALAALLADPSTSWGRIVTCLACWPAALDASPAIAAVEAVADRWPAPGRGLSRLAVRQLLAGDVRPYLRLVRALDLRPLWSMRDHPVLLERMLAAGGMRQLVAFTTRYDRGDALIRLLTAHIVGLRHLSISGSSVGPDGARRLGECPALAGLQRLALHNNELGDLGAEALLASPYLVDLHALNLYNNRLSAAMVERIRGAPQWRGATIIIHNQR
ncbi:hypothetical protein [Nannocystis sp. SCPEA4]|uniref:hypothetical protein n=1 Tax=Nannocystis sp. SCPEA4 TaxID=2996787 RepID=UPI00226EFF9F|nr:hypothetical protein [Nannocystis sp. SCPEA4]MCY1054094.1 hypothetical protein [Nannocystis sp. SCPEA4]